MAKSNAYLILTILITVNLFGSGCSNHRLLIETENNHYLSIKKPMHLKLSDGIWAKYPSGDILITTEFVVSDQIATDYLDQLYGNTATTSSSTQGTKRILNQDAEKVEKISLPKLTAYLIKHKGKYDMLVFAYQDSKQITFVSGKGIQLNEIIQSIREQSHGSNNR